MEISPAAKVGMVVVLALVMLGLVMSQLSYWKHREVGVPYHIVFTNVSGLQVGAPVRKAGVDIGKVSKIGIIGREEKNRALIDKVDVTIYVANRNERLTDKSVYTIASTFMGDKWLEILPRDGKDLEVGGMAEGKTPVTLDDLIVQSEATLSDLRKAVDHFNGLVGDENVQKDIKATVSNFKAISGNLKTASAKVGNTIDRITGRMEATATQAEIVMRDVDSQVKKVGGDVSGFTSTLKRIATTNEKSIDAMVANLKETSNNLNVSMKAIRELVTSDKFGGSILKTLSNLEKTSEQVEGIADDVRTLTSDPQIKEDLKATVHQARETVEGARDLVKRVRASLGLGEGEKLKLMELDSSMEWNTQTGRSAGNANLWVLPKTRHSLKVGVEDIGNNNYFNFQYGKTMKSVRPRIGIVRSQFGIGADAFLGDSAELNVDAYNPSAVQVDVLGRLYFAKDFYIMGGVRDAFDSRQGNGNQGNGNQGIGRQGVIGVGKKF